MSTLNSLLMILVPIGVAFAAGHLLFQRRGSGAVAATSAYGTVMGTFWTLVGVFMIIGGLQIIGGLIIAVAWYLAVETTSGTSRRAASAQPSMANHDVTPARLFKRPRFVSLLQLP